MAARTARTPRKTAAKPTPPVEPEETFEEVDDEAVDADELEELDETEVSESKPAAKGKKATQAITFGIQDLCALIGEELNMDQAPDPRTVRTQIRKMARDNSGRIDREITPGNRSRYDWAGPNDPEVRAIIEAFKAGEPEEDKKAKLQELKDKKAAKTAAEGGATPKKRASTKAAAAVEEVEEDDADEDLDFDDSDE